MLCSNRDQSTGEETFEASQTSANRPSTNFGSSKSLKGKPGYYVAGMATYIFFLDSALLAVVGIGHSRPPTDDASALVGAVVTLVTDAHQGAGPHVGIADHTLAITCEHSLWLQNVLFAIPMSEEKLPGQISFLYTQRQYS